MPKVSVCIPTYNTARFLPQAIESVLAQDYGDYELVICDNASTDNTPDLCRLYDDRRIRYLRYDELVGQAGNWNRCLALARGDLVTVLHADDYLLPGFLADRATRFERRPDLGFVFGAVQVIDAESREVSISRKWPEDRVFEPAELLNDLMLACLVSPPSLMVRRSLIDRVGVFRTDLTWGHDWEWTMRLAEQGAVEYTGRALAAYRVHDGSGTAEILGAAKNGVQERRILRETFARFDASGRRRPGLRRSANRALSRRQMYYAEQCLLAERRSVARNNLWYAVLADATMLARPTFWALLIASCGLHGVYTAYRRMRGRAPVPTLPSA